MKKFLIFTDTRGRKWICGQTLKLLFGIVEVGKPKWWNYDRLCQKSFHAEANHEN